MGRDFYSYNGGLYMSVILDPEYVKIPLHIITPAAALAVRNTLVKYGVKGAKIKWVNDIYLENKKICGILTEAKTEDSKIERIVVGIGINLFFEEAEFPDYLKGKADFVKVVADKATVAKTVVKKLGNYLNKTQKVIADEYGKDLLYIGESVEVSDYSENKKISAKVLGINEDCFLKIELADGTTKLLSSGEII